MNKRRKLAVAVGLTSLFALASQAQAAEFRVYDGTTLVLVPYFKSNCWGTIFPDPKPKGYVDFGNILPGTSFGWDFSDPFITDPACRNPKLEFTYGFFHGETPIKPPSHARYKFDPAATLSVVVGGSILGPPKAPGNDDDDD